MSSYDRLAEVLSKYVASPTYKHDPPSLRACQLALRAAERGNVGVGAILIDEGGKIVLEAINGVLENGYRSDRHAEMVLINRLERKHRTKQDLSRHTILSSLEPCPMCMTRLIFSGVGNILYVASDESGGMVRRFRQLPPLFQQIANTQQQLWQKAVCSETLESLSSRIWCESKASLEDLLK